ncbi:MAG: hypothetical protein ACOVQX_01950 [Legionella sp.]
MHETIDVLKEWITKIATAIEKNENIDLFDSTNFLQEPQFALHLISLIEAIDEQELDDIRFYYSSCIFALDSCIAQLQAASEEGNKLAAKTLDQLMSQIAKAINHNKHSLSYWLPILNAFYEVHVELSEELKQAYFALANNEDIGEDDEVTHLNSIRDLIQELNGLSVFEIAENFFAQSYAMPADFFADLVVDLYNILEGQEIALLALLHPQKEVRDIVVGAFDQLINNITLSSQSLNRLDVIKYWYPDNAQNHFNYWIKTQRKKGVLFLNQQPAEAKIHIKASEIDGSGAQGILIHIQKGKQNRVCGLLYKHNFGIKDAWITPVINGQDVERYYKQSFDDSVALRIVDTSYLLMMTNHFLALTINNGNVPNLYLLEIQEELGLQFTPNKIQLTSLIEELSIQIAPFTEEIIHIALQKTKHWPKKKRFTESWYLENSRIDKIVNQYSNFVDGVKICRFEETISAILTHELELNRDYWLFHFLWVALWLKAKSRSTNKVWQDSFLIAYAIHSGVPLIQIPIMHHICYQSILNSIETMQERRTHLTQP